MKNTKKRGFTIVELVIVIAVIAILASVLIPTFSNVVEAAKKSSALQDVRAGWMDYIAGYAVDNGGDLPKGAGIISYQTNGKTYLFSTNDASFVGAVETGAATYTFTKDAGIKPVTTPDQGGGTPSNP